MLSATLRISSVLADGSAERIRSITAPSDESDPPRRSGEGQDGLCGREWGYLGFVTPICSFETACSAECTLTCYEYSKRF